MLCLLAERNQEYGICMITFCLSFSAVLSAVRSTVAEQYGCTDVQYMMKSSNSSECCLWDFPSRGDNPQGVHKLGYAVGFTSMESSSFCITYPIADSNVDMKNYFIVKVDLQGGPDVW